MTLGLKFYLFKTIKLLKNKLKSKLDIDKYQNPSLIIYITKYLKK